MHEAVQSLIVAFRAFISVWVTHTGAGLADECQLSGLVDGAAQLAGVAAVRRHRLGRCEGQRQEVTSLPSCCSDTQHQGLFCRCHETAARDHPRDETLINQVRLQLGTLGTKKLRADV